MSFTGCALSVTGWVVGFEHSHLQIIDEDDSEYARANGSATYVNAAFCRALLGGGTTFARYRSNDIEGFPGGLARFYDEKSVSGGCSWLLSGHVTRMNI